MPSAGSEPGAFANAFKDPEGFIARWHKDGQPYSLVVFLGLGLVAVIGTLAYGAAVGINTTPEHALYCSYMFCLAAAISWAVPLPALYILGSMGGMRLRASTVFLASLVTAAWGGFALLAFLPIAVVYLLTFPNNAALGLFAHLIVFALVGFSMACIFGRQVERLEPRRGNQVWWLSLFVLLLVVLLNKFDLIKLPF